MLPFVRKVEKYMNKHKLIEKGQRLLIACSGGADSVALVHVLYELREEYELDIGIAHTDHQLRGEESAMDMRFVEQLANRLDLPFYSSKLEVPARVEVEGGNVQVICREERYAFFEKVMEQHRYHKLVLGHHADDQIETVIMSLVRGSLNSSITGIPRTRPFAEGQIIRPFLCVTKKEIFQFTQQLNQLFRHDPSNDKHTYTRNRIRLKVVPLLEEENPNLSDSIRSFVEKQQQDDQFLQTMAEEKFELLVTIDTKGTFFLDTMRFSQTPIALQRRVVLLLLNYIYGNSDILLNDRLIESVLNACNESKGNTVMHLPNGYFLIRHYRSVQFTSSYDGSVRKKEIMIVENCWQEIGAGFSIYLTRRMEDDFLGEKWFIQLEEEALPLSVRQKAEGDRIHIKGMASSKKISRLFIDEKISSEDRLVWPLLVNRGDDILAVMGLRYDEQFSKEYSTQNYVVYVKRN
ncbi:tRNA lysidine(34) synthetase TilS [Psychrobacillus sp.]|uniref:tRNA lysidine(34) synthetase TilS n=1 Tax=Psychrobacillus sp. TaxID=1871623 RepID=UPI0028BDB3A1|nr:tRNA lysidine(34) synthetase TilS [Psychrobacillus sp.]